MYKRILAVFLVALLTVSLSGCGIPQALALDEDKHITLNSVDDDNDRREYDGKIYYLPPLPFLGGYNITEENGYQYLGWAGMRFLSKTDVYTDSTEAPLFLYMEETGKTFLREDYDYRADTFLVEGTGEVICFGEDLLETDREGTFKSEYNTKRFEISSVSCPLLKVKLYVFIEDNEWYVLSNTYMVPLKLSDHFIHILIEHDLVPA